MWYIFLVNQVSLCFCTTCVHIWLVFFCYTRISAHWLCLYFFATQKMNPCLAQYINCIVWDKKKKERWASWESGWSSDEHLLCQPFILLLSLLLFSLLWAVIDLISSSLNWSHDSCCSDWPSLTTHRHSSVMPFAIYLSICLCLLSLFLPSGKSTCYSYRATMTRYGLGVIIIASHYLCFYLY